MTNVIRWAPLAALLLAASAAQAQEIDFSERFALAEDRAAALAELIPGTPDYYYYHCLHALSLERYDEVRELLAKWTDRHRREPRVIEVERRLALLGYASDPEGTLAYLRRELPYGLHHQRETQDAGAHLPTQLPPERVARDGLARQALGRERHGLSSFTAAALPWVAATYGGELTIEQLRDLLRRLRRPDVPGLVGLVARELADARSRGFGGFPIHGLLTLEQLETLAQRRPGLKSEARWASEVLRRLQPSADAAPDAATQRAFLERAWAFVEPLPAALNSLKAHVLYHLLASDLAHGVTDRGRLLKYLALPRVSPRIARRWLERAAPDRRHWAQLHADFRAATGLEPVGDDSALVEALLGRLLLEEDDVDRVVALAASLDATWVRAVFAEVKLLHGRGDAERWYSLLQPAQVAELKQRVELELAPTNPERFAADAEVALELDVKNVPTLLVKVYELDARRLYTDTLAEVDTDLALEGLLPNHELRFDYADPPIRRVRRRFTFPQLTRPGLYVIDFVGGGRSSRALVRRGGLRHLVRTTPAGQTFTVLDEAGRALKDATVWMGGREYLPDAEGAITVPFTGKPGLRPVVLSHGPLSVLAHFRHQGEEYELRAGFLVEREALLAGREATIGVRAGLYLNGAPVSLELLERARLVIEAVDRDGVSARHEVAPFELSEAREATHPFVVPHRLATLRLTLAGEVTSMRQGAPVALAVSRELGVNGIDGSSGIEALHLLRDGAEWALELRGKTGEPKADRPVQLELLLSELAQPVRETLKTDASGRIALGALSDVVAVRATPPEGPPLSRTLHAERHAYPRALHARAGEPLAVPFMERELTREGVGLLEVRRGAYVRDAFDALALEDGLLHLRGLAPGDYELSLPRAGVTIAVRIAAGPLVGDHVVGAARHLEVRDPAPLQIAAVELGQDALRVRLRNASPHTRVHLLASRYAPAFDPFALVAEVGDADPAWAAPAFRRSVYVSGRKLGEEQRYVLERRLAPRLPGNMLERPQLLLNPWAVRDTSTGSDRAEGGEDSFAPGGLAAGRSSDYSRSDAGDLSWSDAANLDFLAEEALVRLNLVPDAEGVVSLPREALGDRGMVRVLACDAETTAIRAVALPAAAPKARDLTMAAVLDPAAPFASSRQTSVVAGGAELTLEDVTTGELALYDSLAKVYRLFVTLSGDSTLVEFGWLLDWPQLDAAQKRARYSKYACHELNFFLSRKDPAFFREVVQPYLRNKLNKTFLDRLLLEEVGPQDLEPWAYGRLNVVERILLGQRLPGELPHTRRHVQEAFEALPPAGERATHLFEMALRNDALAGDGLGLEEARRREAPARMLEDAARSSEALGLRSRRAPGGPPPAEAPAAELAYDDYEEADEGMAEPSPAAAPAPAPMPQAAGKAGTPWRADRAKREAMRQLHRPLEATKEWAENDYYHRRVEEMGPELVTVNGFWRDFAAHAPGQPFLSPRFPEASRNFTEMMFALALLDLPFEAKAHTTSFEGRRMTLVAGGPLVAFHKELRRAAATERSPILVSQAFFRADDRYEVLNGERVDKMVGDELLIHTVYGCRVVVTNPSSTPQRLDVLLQVPEGAIPVAGGRETRSVALSLQPYGTASLEHLFYFPRSGLKRHYPAHVAKAERVVAAVEPVKLKVVSELSRKDTGSWGYVSQYASSEEVLAWLEAHPLEGVALGKIAWRMRDRGFFQRAVALLTRRHAFDASLWAYGLLHRDEAAIRQLLLHTEGFVRQAGGTLRSPLLTIDPVARGWYQHLEYAPLVNARAHPLGGVRKLLNGRVHEQYHRLMRDLCYRRALDDTTLLQVTYYLLLQDRVHEARRTFARVDPRRVATTLQYDYCRAYLDFFEADPEVAAAISAKYRDYPVDRWRAAFRAISDQVAELQGEAPAPGEGDAREPSRLAASEPAFDLAVDGQGVTVRYANLDRVTVSFYPMDVELLFSETPFGQEDVGARFAYVRPRASVEVPLPAGKDAVQLEVPAELRAANLLVEVTGAGRARARALYANALHVSLREGAGQLQVTHAPTSRPLPATYVKVYARMQDGSVAFYKDGYTDLRGRFDYVGLSTDELSRVERFALLVLSDEHGVRVEEVRPPRQ